MSALPPHPSWRDTSQIPPTAHRARPCNAPPSMAEHGIMQWEVRRDECAGRGRAKRGKGGGERGSPTSVGRKMCSRVSFECGTFSSMWCAFLYLCIWSWMNSMSDGTARAPVKSSKLVGSPSLYIRTVGYARIMFLAQNGWFSTQSTCVHGMPRQVSPEISIPSKNGSWDASWSY